MRFILETKLGKLKVTGVKFRNHWEEWCLDNKKDCLDVICGGREYWKETDQGIIVHHWVDLSGMRLKQIPFKFFSILDFSFIVKRNLLTSLINSPEYIGYNLSAQGNKLQNLINGPKKIKGNYYVYENQLISLEGAPEYMYGDFAAWGNKLQNLIGSPKEVEGSYDVSKNQINSLEGVPRYVGKNFYIREQQTPPGKQWTEDEIREKTDVGWEVFV